MELTQDRVQWLTVVLTVLNLRVLVPFIWYSSVPSLLWQTNRYNSAEVNNPVLRNIV